jgi:poly(hydroxyalkanoate) granule associated protein phasin
MATRKNTKTGTRRGGARKAGARSAADVLRETWEATVKSLSAAEAELQKQVRALMKGKGLGAEAAESLRSLGQRLDKERRKVARQIESGVSSLQARVQKERQSAARVVDDTVKGALAALNIPSRHEINELTRKVDELSRKIDGMGSRPARRTPARKAKPAHA